MHDNKSFYSCVRAQEVGLLFVGGALGDQKNGKLFGDALIQVSCEMKPA